MRKALLVCGIASSVLYIVTLIVTMLILPVFGFLAGSDAPRLVPNLPTPWMGVWERINIVATMIWIVVLAIVLLKTTEKAKVNTQAQFFGS